VQVAVEANARASDFLDILIGLELLRRGSKKTRTRLANIFEEAEGVSR
jgi:hypothetical protein